MRVPSRFPIALLSPSLSFFPPASLRSLRLFWGFDFPHLFSSPPLSSFPASLLALAPLRLAFSSRDPSHPSLLRTKSPFERRRTGAHRTQLRKTYKGGEGGEGGRRACSFLQGERLLGRTLAGEALRRLAPEGLQVMRCKEKEKGSMKCLRRGMRGPTLTMPRRKGRKKRRKRCDWNNASNASLGTENAQPKRAGKVCRETEGGEKRTTNAASWARANASSACKATR